jgi:hypothetical protein
MKRLVSMKSGDEYEALTRGGRRVHRFRAGTRAEIKRRFRRRERHEVRYGNKVTRFPTPSDEPSYVAAAPERSESAL